jgi:UDP:flavonoid glycosyltransferase YjiC (YdhE family)
MKAFKPDVVVSDSRVSSVIAAKMLGIPELCILNQFQIIIPRRKRFLRLARLADAFTLTTIGKIWTSGVYTLIPDFPPPYTLSTGNLRIPERYRKCVKLIGPILPIRADDLPSQRDLLSKLELENDKPLIFAPISGPVKERAYFTGVLRKVFKEFPDDYQIVMSLGYPNTSSEPVRDKNVVIYGWTPNRFEYLKACDLVVAKAGHGTLTQAICYGKPLILVPTPNHTEQLNNAKKAVQLGVAELLPQPKFSKQRLLRKTRKILEDRRYQETVERIQNEVAELNGVETAVQMIKDAAEIREHREAAIS